MSATDPVRVSLPRPVWALAGLAMLAMLGFLATQVVLLQNQRQLIRAQRDIAARQERVLEPLVVTARPLAAEALDRAPTVRRRAARADGLVRDATPLVRELRTADVAPNLRAVGALAADLRRADLGPAARATRELSHAVLADGLPADLSAATGELLRKRRLRRLLVRSLAVLGEVQARQLLARATRAASLIPQQVRIQRDTLAVQQRVEALVQQNLDVARDTNAQARRAADAAQSLDRKTGGPAPAAAVPAPPAG